MNQKYTVIHYRLNKKTKPCDVIQTLETLFEKYSVCYSQSLFQINVLIGEYEYEGKFHSNRNKNAVKTLLRKHPELETYYKYTREKKTPPHIREDISICNFSPDDFSYYGEIEYELIRNIVKQVPRPYSVNDLNLIYNGVSFGKKDVESAKIRQSESGFGMPVGNYIWYSRLVYGEEKHSYLIFAVDDKHLDLMRKLFFDLAELLPGKYEEAEYHS